MESDSRFDRCTCGGTKRKCAKRCLACFKAEKRQMALGNPKRRCVCGGEKDSRAELCVQCSHEQSRKRGTICPECNGPKSAKSQICWKCQHKHVARVIDETGTLLCLTCNTRKPATEFYRLSKSQQFRSVCRSCHSNDGRVYNIRRKCRKYGVPPDRIEELMAASSIHCEICSKPVPSFHIDHCHVSGKFRGVLCSNCNGGLGLLRDDPSILLKAVSYLIRHREDDVCI